MTGRTSRKRPPVALHPAKRRAKPAKPKTAKPAKSKGDAELVKMAILARRSGVPSPTIKHYIREGLLPGPDVRTSRNMAYYDARLAARIRVIKSLQAERFLPLRVIGELLEPAPSASLRADRAGQNRALVALAPVVSERGAGSEKRRKRSDVVRSFGITRAELDKLERTGIIQLRGDGETAGYQGADIALLEVLAESRRLGLGDVFPPEVGEDYMAAVKHLVASEIEVFRRHALGRELPLPLPEVARHAARLSVQLIVAMRTKLLPAMLGGEND